MKEFLFLFRTGPDAPQQLSPDELQASTQKWMDWIGGIAAQGKLVARGNRLEPQGRVLKPGNVFTDGPYTEIKETLGGYIVVREETLEQASAMAIGCPILDHHGNVEIRAIMEV